MINKVAILGAGVMGAQIAAQCVNAGLSTLLFDLTAKEGKANSLVEKSIQHLRALKPAPLGLSDWAMSIKACDYDHDLQRLSDCDLIIEAIAERLDLKKSLYERMMPFLTEKTILVTNTSGLRIQTLAGILPEAVQANFCGMHFFNPPRYMHLVELIPTHITSPKLLDTLETWLTTRLGKGVLRAKDTPNFIANRIGVFSLLAILHHAETMGLGLDEVDALTGPLIGRPKSATFRTMDVVGLDTLAHVVKNMQQELVNDPWHNYFYLPEWLMQLIEKGDLGQKTGQGLYRKQKNQIEVYDPNQVYYRPVKAVVSDEVNAIFKLPAKEQLRQLMASTHPQAQFLTACFLDTFHYAAYHLMEIAHSVRDIDLALSWGFGWHQGPFSTWQTAGVDFIRVQLNQAIQQDKTMANVALPSWVKDVEAFYQGSKFYSPEEKSLVSASHLPVYARQLSVKKQPILFENEGITLYELQDEVGVIEFKTKSNTIGQSVLEGMNQALDKAATCLKGIIIHQHDENNFSSGANLKEIASLLKDNRLAAVEEMLTTFQALLMRIKYSAMPIIAAVRGRALGGGTELLMHCSNVMAAFESYPGLVEVGVGVIPAGGGCKEMAMRAANFPDLMHTLSAYFEQIATAFVAGSAPEAIKKGYFKPTDRWMMHRDEVLYAALQQVNTLVALNYAPPQATPFPIAGREGAARLQTGLVNWFEGRFISAHDYFIGSKLAYVLCGGDLNQGELVDERWLLKLEVEAFLELAATAETQQRISHILETGKPLRN